MTNDRQFFIGCSGYPIDRGRYQCALNFVELTETRQALPRDATVRKWLSTTPAGFRFGLVAPSELADPGLLRPTPSNVTLLDRTLAIAATLDAVVRIHSTPAFGPGDAAFDGFRDLLSAVDRRGVTIAWEPRGVMKDAEVIDRAGALGLVPVLDPFQDRRPPGPDGFVRIHPFMTMSDRLSDDRLQALAAHVGSFERCFVVFDTPAGYRDACALRRLLTGGPAPADEPIEPDAESG